MRCLFATFTACTIALLAFGSAPASCQAQQGQKQSTEAPVQFLIDSAARDFHSHAPRPTRFRHVRIGHVINPDGTMQYRLCGEFLSEQAKSNAEWMSFVTIKTSGYEQYVGGQGAAFCQGPKFTVDKTGDLSSELQSRFDSMQ